MTAAQTSVDSAYATATGVASTVTNASTIELSTNGTSSTQLGEVNTIAALLSSSTTPKVEFINDNILKNKGRNNL